MAEARRASIRPRRWRNRRRFEVSPPSDKLRIETIWVRNVGTSSPMRRSKRSEKLPVSSKARSSRSFQPVQGLREDRLEQGLLAGEVAIERRLADAGFEGDVLDRGLLVAEAREHPARRLQKAAAAHVAPAFLDDRFGHVASRKSTGSE